MAGSVLVDSGFLVALIRRNDRHHAWAAALAERHPPPWFVCEAVLSESFYLLSVREGEYLREILARGAVRLACSFDSNIDPILALMRKYAVIPMSFADACLVRMTETLANPLLLTPDSDFQIYRRNNRQVIPCVTPIRG